MDSIVEGNGFTVAAQGFPTPALPFSIGLHSDQNWGSINIDDVLQSIYADPDPYAFDNVAAAAAAGVNHDDSGEEVLWNIPSNDAVSPMTLEDFLVKAGAFGTEKTEIDSPLAGVQFDATATDSGSASATSLTAAEEAPAPVDKATQRRLRRMRKNRESAARSRERKQAYTVGLESMVSQLEKVNAELLKEEAELMKERYKQLMKNLIPVTESRKRKPYTALKRMSSM